MTTIPAADTAAENYVAVTALVDELVRAGLHDFVVCPGSRSTPLAVAIARAPAAKLWMHLDERSAAYFGLGLAKTKRAPVALLCTSGSAAANFFPAVVEAFLSRVPLVVLTADRPHELRDNGAPQTIDQIRLYGTHVKWFVDLAEPAGNPAQTRYLRAIAGRAVATATRAPAGPVHLNLPFREPLLPRPVPLDPLAQGRDRGRPYVSAASGRRAPDKSMVSMLASELVGRRGLILCGPQNDRELAAPATRLAGRLGFPILADPLSGLRCGAHDRDLVFDCYDAFLRDAKTVARLEPEVVLRFGDMPTSKPVLQYLERYPGARFIVVDDDSWKEPTQLASDLIQADASLFCEALESALPVNSAERSPSVWLELWRDVDRRARQAIKRHLGASAELFEGRVMAELAELLPDDATVFVGNSMPVRDLDTFFPGSSRRIRFLANRGANGIDGVVSSALGASAGSDGPAVLVIGDISFYHDSNGLFAAKRHGLDLTIVLVNNDGGGIFSFLEQASDPEHFEQLFGTPHGLSFQPIVETYGASFSRIGDWAQFRAAVAEGLTSGGLHVVEVPTDRSRNVTLHRDVWRLVADALAREPQPEGIA